MTKQNDVIGKWRLEKFIGEGGQGSVWKVRHITEKHCPPAALKVYSGDGAARARFEREIALMAAHKHAHLIALKDSGVDGGQPYFVMDLATASLDRLANLDASPGIRLLQQSPTLLLTFFRQASTAISFLHAQDVVHRDIKPHNILLCAEPQEPVRAVVCDLGIAVEQSEQGQLTRTQEVVGTPTYRAPELSFGQSATPQSDIFGLGRVLEFLMTGTPPSTWDPRPCPRGRGLSDELCDRLDAVIRRACAHAPPNRYSTVDEMLTDLPVWEVGCTTPKGNAAASVPTTIDDDAVYTLAHLIGLSSRSGATVPLWSLRDAIKRRLSAFDQTMAMQTLSEAGFLESREEADDHGNPYEAVVCTAAGYMFAQRNREQMKSLIDQDRIRVQRESTDDIPF